jgi:hypothetical protein
MGLLVSVGAWVEVVGGSEVLNKLGADPGWPGRVAHLPLTLFAALFRQWQALKSPTSCVSDGFDPPYPRDMDA